MSWRGTLGLVLAATLAGTCCGSATTQSGHHIRAARHQARHAGRRHDAVVPPYVPPTASTPACRYPDGTPYDPDIIGGADHVGDGGPAANLGGFDPCGY